MKIEAKTKKKIKQKKRKSLAPSQPKETTFGKYLIDLFLLDHNDLRTGSYIKKKELLAWILQAIEKIDSTKVKVTTNSDMQTSLSYFLWELHSFNPHSLKVQDLLPLLKSFQKKSTVS